MKLLAVIISLLILTTGCVMAKEPAQPVVQPQPVVVEQPTYQGETQYDYNAGAPDVPSNPVIEPEPYIAPAVPPTPQYTLSSTSGGGGYTPWVPYYPPAPAVRVNIITGTVIITVN